MLSLQLKTKPDNLPQAQRTMSVSVFLEFGHWRPE